mgnify:CR=1 FL=1
MKKVKTLTIILIVVLLTMVAFFGIYTQVQNRMENQVKDYELAMDLKGARTIRLKVSEQTNEVIKDAEGNIVETEETLTDEQLAEKGYTKEEQPVNSQEILTTENYQKSKKILENRLKNLGVSYYEIALEDETGDIVIRLPEDNQVDNIVSNISTVGKFEILDSQTKEVLMNNNDIKLANVLYGSEGTNGTAVYLNIEFTKEGAKKLENISNTYIHSEEESTEENTTTEENATSEEKKISMQIDGQEMMNTDFEEPIRTGKLQLSIGSSTTDTQTLQEHIQRAANIANILDNGNMPIQYEMEENKYVLSDITEEQLQWVKIAIAIVIGLGAIYFIFKYKGLGILGAISTLGLAAIYLLTIRYTNVILALTGIFGIFVIILLNDVLVNKMLEKIKREKGQKATKSEVKEAVKESYKEYFLKLIPICISVIVLCFINWTPISSFGMVMFWGILLIAVYNYIITNGLLKIRADK